MKRGGCEGHSGRLARGCLGGISTRKSAEGEGLRRRPLACRRGEYLSNPAPESRIGAPGAFLGAESGSGVVLRVGIAPLKQRSPLVIFKEVNFQRAIVSRAIVSSI